MKGYCWSYLLTISVLAPISLYRVLAAETLEVKGLFVCLCILGLFRMIFLTHYIRAIELYLTLGFIYANHVIPATHSVEINHREFIRAEIYVNIICVKPSTMTVYFIVTNEIHFNAVDKSSNKTNNSNKPRVQV